MLQLKMTHYFGYEVEIKDKSGKYAWFIYQDGVIIFSSGYDYPTEATAYDCACSRIDTLF
jgi:hypothetical protein